MTTLPETTMTETRYDFGEIEPRLAAAWERAGCFDTIMDGRPSFSIMMPPPNVTGTLHLGHALDNTLPDILVRRARMQGKNALYQPGTDHASIAVHVVLERKWAKEGKTRFDYGREAFMEQAWAWKDHSAGVITGQLRRLGISCDWSNERFTMDPAYSRAVNKVFVMLHERGLIYRGQRLVNWDPKMQTAVSDLEVKHKEVKGHLWHVRYKFADGGTYAGLDGIEIATTRPETILADGAIAIHPTDLRAKDLVGRKVLVPLVERAISIVADEMVDPDFGSGMVKITAAHDFNDFAFYQRHKDRVEVPLINLLTPDAKMNENCPAAYVGLDRFAARKKIVADLDAAGLLIKTELHTHNVGHAERDDTVLEPYLTWQWYVKAGPLAEKCLAAADRGDVKFVNARDEKVYRHWLENIQDWCISRQLWWGHQVPAWYKGDEVYVGERAPEGEGWVQDQDILDTWFSSALWPFVTQGWPEGGERLQAFYPNTVINSGRDILFFWLIRMMMMGLEVMGRVPFGTIYTHGLILDGQGQKMSKSKGNVIDPTELIEKYGADALRMAVVSVASAEDMKFSDNNVLQARNFGTKLWNAGRYLQMQDVRYTAEDAAAREPLVVRHAVNNWLIGELKGMFARVDAALDGYEFARAAHELYHFVWGTWCDWYVELTKPLLQSEDATLVRETKLVMGWAWEQVLVALHPVMPFMTEELWQRHVVASEGQWLMLHRWPTYASWNVDTAAQAEVATLVEMVGAVRQFRTMNRISPKVPLTVGVRGAVWAVAQRQAAMLQSLGGIGTLTAREAAGGKGEAVLVVRGGELIVPLAGLVDVAAERARLHKVLETSMAERAKLEGLLGNEGFVARANPEVVAGNRVRVAELVSEMGVIEGLLRGAYAE